MRAAIASIASVAFILGIAFTQERGLPPGVKDTQDPRDKPPSPEHAVRRFKAPDGFHVTLFAGEPDVHQPIAMAFDDRGRLWVAECFSYPKWLPPEQASDGRDRILIFEDTDGDGRFDKRTVFHDRLPNLTGLELGYGGVWALCAPNLVFIPDRNGDDVPDGPPEVVLDGWSLKAEHNIVNGLTWGPDGWLWGRHGILHESRVGRPGTPDSARTRLNCSIWRYHPTRKLFEVVTHGTTNPWGLDFDAHGEAFFTNSVTGHLWHAVPGARFQRMYGLDYNPHAYELIAPTSDHLHWGGGHWTDSRGGKGVHSDAGGGHAHAGAMVYLGDNWPDEYRHSIFMCNIHGNRLNRNLLERSGASYVGKRAPDFLLSDNPWFRGIALGYGPDGGVFVTDWCDFGECHDHDGVHRSSGRVYKVFHGKPRSVAGLDLSKKTDAELVAVQLHKNDWYVRHARRLLAERAADGKPMAKTHEALRKVCDAEPKVATKLRALWVLYVTGGADERWLLQQTGHANEHVRSWAVRLLCDGHEPSAAARAAFLRLAVNQPSGLVRLYLASALQRLKHEDRFPLAGALAMHAADRDDREVPLLLWYGIEPAVPKHPDQALALAEMSGIPKLRQFIARRLADDSAAHLDSLVALVNRLDAPAKQLDVVEGMREGLKGRRKVQMPRRWQDAFANLEKQPVTQAAARRVGLIFGEARADTALRLTLTAAT